MSVATQSPELDIQACVGEIIAPYTPPEKSRQLFTDFVEQLDLPDADRFKYVRFPADGELLLPLIADPHDTVVSEMQNLRGLSDKRTLHGRAGLQAYDIFVTRSAAKNGIDATYRQCETPPSGNPLITIETKLQDQLEDACIFRVSNGALKIIERQWKRGAWHDLQREVQPGSRGEKLLLGLVSSTLWGGHLAITRTEIDRQAADAEARKLAFSQLGS